MRSRRTVVAVAALVFAIMCGPAQAKPLFPPEITVATSARDLIAVPSACVLVSHDRGRTGSKGACFDSPSEVMLDPATGAAYVLSEVFGAQYEPRRLLLYRLDANGAIVESRQIPFDDPSWVGPGAVMAGTLYVTRRDEAGDDDATGNSRAKFMHRYAPDGSSRPCATPPPGVQQILAMPRGVLLALGSPGDIRVSEQIGAISRDACASWAKMPRRPGKSPFECTSTKLFSPVRAYLGCYHGDDPNKTTYALDYDKPPKWRRTGLGGVGFDAHLDVFVPADESAIHLEPDDYGHPGWPAGWLKAGPRRPDVGGRAPGGKAARAFRYINGRFRDPLGLPDLRWSVRAGKAAQNHATYYGKNGYSGHGEKRGKPGFTGRTPVDRCQKVGLPKGCSEVASPRPGILDAVHAWMATPLHSPPFLHSDTIGLGWSKNGSVGNPGEFARVAETIYVSRRPNTPGSSLKVWPADGMKNVGTEWVGAEQPDPLEFYKGDRSDVGPVLFVSTDLVATFTLTKRGSTKTIPLLRIGGKRATRTLTTSRGYGFFLPVFAARELKPRTSYVVTAKLPGRSHRFEFRTATRSSPIP